MSLLDAIQLARGETPSSSSFNTVDEQKKKKNSLLEAVQVARGDISSDSLNQSTQQTHDNSLQSLVSSITSFVKDKVSEIFHPNSFLDTNKLPSNLSLSNNSNSKNQNANLNLSGTPQNALLPTSGTKIAIPAPPKVDNGNSSNLISPFNTGVPFVDLAPSTMDLLANLQVDPFSLKNAPKVTLQSLFSPLGRGPIVDNITNNYLKGIKDAVSADAEAIKGVFSAQSTSERVGAGAQVAARSVGAAISPLTSLFNAANDIPVLGTVSKLISLPFAVIGDTGKDLAYPVVNMLPISRQAKLNLVDGIGEITSLALMLGVGGKVADVPGKIREELTAKYGPTDAATIENQAKVLAQQKIDTQQKSFTPEEIRSQTKNFGVEGTPTGQILNQAASVAENQGKNIKILPAPEDQKLLPATSSIPVTTGEGFQVSDTVNKQKLDVAKAINEYDDVYRKYNTSPTSAKLKKLIELKTKKDQLLQQYNQTEGITGNYMAEMPGGHAVSVELTDKNQPHSEQVQQSGQTQAQAPDNLPQHAGSTDAQLIAEYRKQFANHALLNTDNVREVYKPQGYNRINSADFHDRASALSDKIFQEDIGKLQPGDNYLFTAGSSGSGKSTAIASDPAFFSDIKAGLDGNFSSDSSLQKLDKVVATGANVRIAFVYRDPIDAWINGVVRRAINPENGRVVPLDVFLKNLEKSPQKVLEAYKKYGDKLDIQVYDNNYGKGKVKLVSNPIEFLRNISYNMKDVKSEIIKATEERIKNGTISQETGKALLGSENPTQFQQEPQGRQASAVTSTDKSTQTTTEPTPNSTSEGNTPSKIAKSIERKAIEQKLTEGFDGVAGYDKTTIKEQTDKVAKILENIDEARAIIRGEKPVPQGVNEAMLIKGAEDYAAKIGDGKLLYDLANSPLTSETSHAAQILRFAAERQPDSLTARLQAIKKARLEAAQKKYGNEPVDKIIKNEVIRIKADTIKPKKEDWASFVRSIQC